MNTAPLAFLTPIIAKDMKSQSLWGSLARKSDSLLAYGKHVYVITEENSNQLTVQNKPIYSGKEKLYKAFLIATVIIPLFAFVIKVLDRTFVNYQLATPSWKENIAKLESPDQIQEMINKGADVLSEPAVKTLLEVVRDADEYGQSLEPYRVQLDQIRNIQEESDRLQIEIDYSKYVSLYKSQDLKKELSIQTLTGRVVYLYIKEEVKLKYVEAALRAKEGLSKGNIRFTLKGKKLLSDEMVRGDYPILIVVS